MTNRRKYELKERALRQRQTRERIIQTVVALHEEVGPARTTVVEIARRAGVSRPTVYEHFPDEGSLIRACAGYWLAANVPPDPAEWAGIADPKQRLRVALRQLYDYYRSRARMLTHVLRDAAFIPSLSEAVEGSLGNYRETAVE